MRKLLVFICVMFCFCCFVSAQENAQESAQDSVETEEKSEEEQGDFRNFFVPDLSFQALQIGEKDGVFSPSASLRYIRTKKDGVESSQPDSLMVAASYTPNIFTAGLGKDNVRYLHSLSMMGSVGFGKNNLLVLVSSDGEVLFSDIRTIFGGLLYTHEFFKNDSFSLSLGAGLVVGDLGIKIRGVNIYVIPLPMFSLSYSSDILDASLSLLGLNLTLFPKKMFRFEGQCAITRFDSIRNLTFDCKLVYYPLHNTEAGDFLAVAAGVMNEETSFSLRDKDKYGWQYYCVYGEVDASLVRIKAGYHFNGKNLLDDEPVSDLHKGFFASIQAMYFF